MTKNDLFFSAFKYAFSGLLNFIRSERNAKIHLGATILVIIVASFLHLSVSDWLFLVLAIFLVWITELINTTLEDFCDLTEPNINPLVKIIKDGAAAAVLLAAVFSVITGILILGPAILEKLTRLFR